MTFMKIKRTNILESTIAGVCIILLTACNGVFDDIYDKPQTVAPVKGQLMIDATSWTDWYYVDLPELRRLSAEGDDEALLKAQTQFQAYPIPMSRSDNADTAGADGSQGESGQYMYWFDVFGEGITKNEFRHFTPTDAQAEPSSWTFAVHRNNVRTNGGAVMETQYSSIDELPESNEWLVNMQFIVDEWSENEVWDSQEQMLQGLVPSQGIKINKVLSSWLSLKIPPMPPAFAKNSHVFILRLSDGTYAALQLQDYLSPNGTKCWLTINYKYPY